MPIEFIRDEFLEGKKEELDNINEALSEKPKKMDRKVLFLKRFTFALMGQYKIQKKHLYQKNQELGTLNKQIFQGVKFQIPTAPSPMLKAPRPQMQAPKPMSQPRIKVPSPLKEEIKIPEPIEVEIPREKLNVQVSPVVYISTNNNHEKIQEKKDIPA